MNTKKAFLFLMLIIMLSTFTVLAGGQEKNKIAFFSDRYDNYDIFLINEDGSDLIRLTDSEDDDKNPVWSPDGKNLLYISGKGDLFKSNYDLWVVNLDSRSKIKLAEDILVGKAGIPAWSPDGEKIVYVTDEDNQVIVVNADGSKKINLTSEGIKGSYPIWSPDGKNILVTKDGKESGVYLISPDGSRQRKIVDDKGGYENLTWSPEGNKITFVYNRPLLKLFGNKSGIYLYDILSEKGSYFGDGNYVSWCPDNKSLAYIFTETEFDRPGDPDSPTTTYYTTKIAYAKVRNKSKDISSLITTTSFEAYPAWSPDGNKIAYKKATIVFIRISGDSRLLKYKVPSSGLISTPPAWGPDSEKIVVVGYPKLLSTKSNLYIFDVQSQEVSALTDMEGNEFGPVWAPRTK